MSSFGDGDNKTEIQEYLSYIAENKYSEEFYEDKEAQRQFVLDVLAVLRYICGEW